MELISSLLYNIVPFIIILTTLVFVHEFGHFWVARKSGVKVEVFSIGFGKELFGFNDKYGTRWKFCLIPMGGYIKMFGDKGAASNSDESLIKNLSPEEQKVAFPCKSLLTKSAIVAAGPAANYLFSALIFTFFFFIYGYPQSNSTITEVVENSAASKSGIRPGDVINEINGITVENFSDIKEIMSLNLGETISVKINNQEEAGLITPEKFIEQDILGHEVESYKLGIITDHATMEKQNIFNSAKLAIFECYRLSKMTLKAIGQMITGKRSSHELGGPIKIAQYSAKSAEAGIGPLLWFMALLSVNLGLLNLLPIPALDGGHLLFYLIEVSLGKKIAIKIQNYSFKIGLILLLMLTIFVIFNDLTSLVSRH
jgi:regulator of sigma E protease